MPPMVWQNLEQINDHDNSHSGACHDMTVISLFTGGHQPFDKSQPKKVPKTHGLWFVSSYSNKSSNSIQTILDMFRLCFTSYALRHIGPGHSASKDYETKAFEVLKYRLAFLAPVEDHGSQGKCHPWCDKIWSKSMTMTTAILVLVMTWRSSAFSQAVISLLTRVNQKSAQNTWLMVRQFVLQQVF